ncbi:MAG: biotin transporter BioY [Ignavibacteriaceae bacterium]|nr:biotin transporter BioY [Ignavibacteriaceae bacterium]
MMIKESAKNSKMLKTLSLVKSSKLFWILSFTVLTAISAQIAIPVKPVPFTLQTMMVVLAGAFLGARNGAYSQIIYLALGSIGLPIFAQTPDGLVGFARLFGPTGGYLLAFPIAAYLTGYIIEKNKSYIPVVLAMFAGNVVIILSGMSFLYTFYIRDLSEAFILGAAIFSLWTIVKVFASAAIYFGIKKSIK